MADDGQETMNQAKLGMLSLAEIQNTFSAAEASTVASIQDWGVCYDSGTGQLSEYCVVTATNSSNPITGVGMLAYSADGSKVYAVQYSNGFSSDMFATSIGTTMYTPADGNMALCVVYGWTNQGSFYFTQTMTIASCQ
jgi:hypothetical protein